MKSKYKVEKLLTSQQAHNKKPLAQDRSSHIHRKSRTKPASVGGYENADKL